MLNACRPNWSLLFLLFLVGCASSPPRPSTAALGSWVEIDGRALAANVRTVQRALAGKSRLCAVLKADAYGHGIALVMPVLRRYDVDCVAITSNEEAAAVRATGFSGRLIRIRTASVEEIEAALDLRLEELIGNLALAKRLSAFAAEKGIDLPYHLALNAGGMSRNGIELRTARDEREAIELLHLPRLRLVGIMTHFPVENAADVRRVLAEFVKEAGWITVRSGRPRAELTWHAANTFATLEVPESRLDLVRVGGALYGDATGHPEFRRVMAFKSRVAALNTFPAGNTVSYDRTLRLARESVLANIPVGYSNGYRRHHSNRATVLIHGQRVPLMGRVTMNTILADVTDHPEIRPGDEVVLFGRQGALERTQAELEKETDTILAELYTQWGLTNPRVLLAD